MYHTKIVQADLDVPCRELSMYGLGFVVALPFLGIKCSCAFTGGPMQL